jgi:signal transduction histidine kinase
LRRRILLLVVGMTTLVVLAFAVPAAILIRSVVTQRAERATVDQAANVALFVRSGSPSDSEIEEYANSQTSTTGRPTSVVTSAGTVLGAPTTFSVPPLDDHHGGGEGGGDGGGGDGGGPAPQVQLHAVSGGETAEAVVRAGEGEYFVRVFVSTEALHDGENAWWLLLGGSALGLLLIGIVAGEVLTRRIVRPLVHTADTARQLAAGDTTARAPTDGPGEVGEVGVALNRLADRIDELIAEERETVADLSHRLRTPLTALRLDAEALQDPEEAERVGTHVSSLERMLTAVIRAARRPQREGRMPSCDATTIVGDRIRFWSALADDQARASTVELPRQPVLVRASAEDLAAAVDALLENVVAHTPEGTPFSVRLTAAGIGARLDVADDGTGIPSDAEVRGRSDRGSSGLGLDIARRCAEASGGSMVVARTPSGGALVTLQLGAP